MNVLIVDDREENRYLLEALLKGNGHHVEAAANGAEALEKLKSGAFELIISDILMPVMDGFQLCRKVKTNEALRHIPFIVYTATYTGPQDEAFALKIGADRFIQKPCEPEAFMEAVRDVTEAAKHRDPASTPALVHDDEMLKLYSERLVRKLEQKMLELEKEVQIRREMEETLRASERTFKAVFESAIDGMLVADVKTGRFVIANKAMCRMLGYSAEEIKRLTVADIHPVESLDYVRLQFEKQVRGEISLAPDVPVKRKDRSVFIADVNSAPLDLGGLPHLLGVFRDITERKQGEKAIKEAYDIINRSSSVAFTWKNQEGWPAVFVSENVQNYFGYTAEEFMTGKVRYADCIHPDDLGRVAREVAEYSNKAKTTDFVHEPYRIMAKDGREKIISDWTYIVRDKDGRITHFKGIVEDISGRKRAEEEKAKMEAQLIQAQKLEAVARLTAGIAHDFNNLLTTIIGNAEMALMDLGKEEPFYEVMVEINEAGKRAASLTRQLLAFSRKQILRPEILDLNGVVRDTDKMLRRLIGEDIEVETILSPDLGRVEADVGQIEQVLMNLVVNARDAMPEGGKLTIETGNVELDEAYAQNHVSVVPGCYVMLAVSDTGAGMTREVQAHLFEPFFTTKERGKGTGLGLSTVYGIVKQSKGNIWVYSEEGKGTTFKIYLPRVEGPGSVTEKPEKEEESLQGSETILVVEDDETVRNLALNALKRYGYTVLCARDGEEALRMCRERTEQIQLMLSDVVMPGMSGKDLAEEIKGLRPGLKVLFMSGYTDNSIVRHGVLENGIAFLQKPFTPEALARKVRKALGD